MNIRCTKPLCKKNQIILSFFFYFVNNKLILLITINERENRMDFEKYRANVLSEIFVGQTVTQEKLGVFKIVEIEWDGSAVGYKLPYVLFLQNSEGDTICIREYSERKPHSETRWIQVIKNEKTNYWKNGSKDTIFIIGKKVA